ncbi:MAG TPA: nucleoside deaminase [Terriglobia bacterium]|nr:nucleoside deaminase [Terriglobia bacterium]
MHEPFMREAIALSVENVRAGRGGPFAALVVKGATVVARGVNLVSATNDPTAHAEVMAIRAACQALGSFRLAGCEIYTTCEPCPMCLSAIYWARLDKYYYANTRQDAASVGFDDSLIYHEIALPPEQRAVPGERLLADEAATAFQEWMRSPVKVSY